MSDNSKATATNEGGEKQKSFPIGQKFQCRTNPKETYMLCQYNLYGDRTGELALLLLDSGRILQNFPNMSEFVDYIHTETNLTPV